MSWTEARIDQLRQMWQAGHTASQIAETLGGVSRNAVIGKAHRLGLQSRPSPVKAGDAEAAAPVEKPAPAAAPPPPVAAAPVPAPAPTPAAPPRPVAAVPPPATPA